MNPINVAICEDNQDELDRLLKIINLSNIPTKCTTFKCGEDFLNNYSIESYDLIIMDIIMNKITGIDVIKSIREIGDNTLVAFITSSLDYALESYRLNAVKYIEKPINNKQIFNLLEIAHIKIKNTPSFTIKKNGEDYSIPYNRIVYLEQQGRNLIIHILGNNIIEINEKIDKIESQFIRQSFIRCHKSYSVNLSYIKSLNKDLCLFEMKEGGNAYIRRESMSQSKKAYEDYLFNKAREIQNEEK